MKKRNRKKKKKKNNNSVIILTMENLIYAYQVKDKDSFFTFAKKRESGEKPERTGHCKQEICL